MKTRFLVLAIVALLARGACFAASFMDITSLTPGVGTAGWTGTLNGVGVIGTLAAPPNVSLNAVGPGVGASTIINDSPQWSHLGIYTPVDPLTDRVGWSRDTIAGAGTVTVAFASPMTDLVFHIANLDFSTVDFTPSIGGGLTGMTLIAGNGGPGDGLGLGAPLIFDNLPGTADGTPPGTAPPIAGPRSGYGSVLLSGTYTSLTFSFLPGAGIDNGNFTFSTPEPGRAVFAAIGLIGIALRRRRMV